MRRAALVLCMLFMAIGVSQAFQVKMTPVPAKPPANEGPKGEDKLRWVCRQLRLDSEQSQQAEALITLYKSRLEEMSSNALELMTEMRDLAAEIKAKQEAGDTAAVAALQERLRNLAPSRRAENEFFENLSQYLTEDQKARLPQVRARAEVVGDVKLRPAHVVKLVLSLELTNEQRAQFETLMRQYREDVRRLRPQDENLIADRVQQFATDARALLTPDQQKQFDTGFDALQQNAPPAEQVALPNTTPADQPQVLYGGPPSQQ